MKTEVFANEIVVEIVWALSVLNFFCELSFVAKKQKAH